MENTTKALYTSLRMRFLEDPTLQIERWKVEDFRALSLDELFSRLGEKDITLDKARFIAYANEYDTPEELTETFVDEELEEESDYIYLLVFELWRRLVPEKQTITLIADELDYQIFLYDTEAIDSVEALDDAIASVYEVLKENVDHGALPKSAFFAIQEFCAHDILSFLYDYISQLIQARELAFAAERIEEFYPFIPEKKWFDFLHAQIIGVHEPKQSLAAIGKIITTNRPDLLLNFDIMEYLCGVNSLPLFCDVAKQTLSLLTEEEDLQELMGVCSEYFSHHSREDAEKGIQAIKATGSFEEKKAALSQLISNLQ